MTNLTQNNATNLASQNQDAADKIDIELEVEQFHAIGEKLINLAKQKGASEVEVGVSKDIGLSVQVRNQEVETLEYNRDNSFGLTVYFGKQKGVATTSDLSPQALEETVNAACNIAKYTQADECAGLADKALMATNEQNLMLDWPMNITANAAKEIALECEDAALSFSNKVSQSEGATFNSHRNIRFMANSHGFSAAVPSTRHSLSSVMIAKDNQGMQRDYYYTIARDNKDMQSAKWVGEKSAEKVIERLGGKQIITQKAPVMFSPEMARGLVSHFCSAIKGSSLYRQSSFLLNSINTPIFPEFVQMQETPFLPKGLASSWFDSEGVATKEQSIIDAGVLQTYLLNSYSARRLNLTPTGHAGGLHNLNVSSTGQSFEQMLAKMNTGLFVTEVMGQGVNLVNGDYSRGASGFWVENGQIKHFVEEITIAGNLKNMFANIVAIGSDIDTRSSVLTGSWLIEEMTIAGI